MVADRALERARVIRAAAGARHEAVLLSTTRLLDGLNRLLASSHNQDCNTTLSREIMLQAGRYSGLARIDHAGHILCTAGPSMASMIGDGSGSVESQSWFHALVQTNTMAIAQLSGKTSGSAADRLIVAIPYGEPGAAQTAMVASLAIDWLDDSLANGVPVGCAWLIDDEGKAVPLGNADAKDLPPDRLLTAMVTPHVRAILAEARDGTEYAYAVALLTGHLRLLVATPATGDIAIAREILARRLLGLGLLLAAGLAAVAFGANQGVVLPIKRLSSAVEAWRMGGTFDPGPPAGMPLEVRQLSSSFAQAIGALAEREQQLIVAHEQQALLMQEIHHRVKNNLQIIASLMNLQASRIRLPEAKREFQSARDRIRALATLHRHLYAHGDLHTINMRSFLHELCDQLLQAIGESAGGRIQLDIEAPELQISSDQAVPMALIVTEAVSNAAKYAFPGGRPGHIQVRLTTEGNNARLVIQDDGVGIPAGPAQTETGVRDGIGLHLIKGFARQLGGRLTVTQDNGTRYTLDLQVVRERETEPDAEALATIA